MLKLTKTSCVSYIKVFFFLIDPFMPLGNEYYVVYIIAAPLNGGTTLSAPIFYDSAA